MQIAQSSLNWVKYAHKQVREVESSPVSPPSVHPFCQFRSIRFLASGLLTKFPAMLTQ